MSKISEFLSGEPVYHEFMSENLESYDTIEQLWCQFKRGENIGYQRIADIFKVHIKSPEHLIICYQKGFSNAYVMLHSKSVLSQIREEEINDYIQDHQKIDYEDYLLMTNYRDTLPFWRFCLKNPQFQDKMYKFMTENKIQNGLIIACYVL